MFRHTQVAVNSASASRTGLSPSAAGRSGPFRSLPLRMTPLLLPRHMPCDTAGLGSSPFDRLYLGNRCYFLFLRVLRCFSSPGSPRAYRAVSGSLPTGCPIRTSGGLSVFATRPGFSQLVTSFFASESQGIPHAPFCVPFFLQRNFFKVPSGTSQKPYWSLTLVCSCETFVFLLVLADILALCRTDVSLPACQCSLLMWRITDSNR